LTPPAGSPKITDRPFTARRWDSIMAEEAVIARVIELSRDRLSALLAESEASGYRFVRRLADEWDRGINRFSRPGEALLAAECGGQLVGVCGLNVDPYQGDPRVGRVRNVYVLAACRGRGIGRRLVGRAVAEARAVSTGSACGARRRARRGSTSRSDSGRAPGYRTARTSWNSTGELTSGDSSCVNPSIGGSGGRCLR
jgi:GNAT superfamily N-acetyltransferase